MNRIEVESFLRRFGHRNVARVDRVERAAKKRNGPPVAMPVGFLRRVRTQTSSPGGALLRFVAVACAVPSSARSPERDISRYSIAPSFSEAGTTGFGIRSSASAIALTKSLMPSPVADEMAWNARPRSIANLRNSSK